MIDIGILHGLCRNLTGFIQVFYRVNISISYG